MTDDALKETIVRLAEPVAASMGLDIWGVELVRSGRTVVRLFVDRPAGRPAPEGEEQDAALLSATLDQCAELSRHLGLALDVEDCFPDAWVLEVSSPGLERRFFALEQMRPYLGDMVEARLAAPLPDGGADAGRRVWRGRLAAVEAGAFVLEPAAVTAEGEVIAEAVAPVRVPWDSVRRACRVHVFRRPTKPGRRPAAAGSKGGPSARNAGR